MSGRHTGGFIQTHRTILTDLKIWDGEQSLEADTLILNGPHIETVAHSTALSAAERRIARSMSGLFALPGLMDAHVHMVLDPNRSAPPGPDELPDSGAMRERAAMMVRAGITTARDLGGDRPSVGHVYVRHTRRCLTSCCGGQAGTE